MRWRRCFVRSGTSLGLENSNEWKHSVLVPLPFAFPFYGKTYLNATIDRFGNIFLGECPFCGSYAPVGGAPRIAVAAHLWDPTDDDNEAIVVLDTGSSFVISWEMLISTIAAFRLNSSPQATWRCGSAWVNSFRGRSTSTTTSQFLNRPSRRSVSNPPAMSSLTRLTG